MIVIVTYPERVSGSGETGEAHTAYKFVLITKWSTCLQVNSYQNTITMGVRKRKAKLLGKSYEYNYRIQCSKKLIQSFNIPISKGSV